MENAYEKCLKGAKKMFVPVVLFSVGWTTPSWATLAVINENASSFLMEQVSSIEGKVVDVNGEPIIGASVIVKGTSNGTITDVDGRFSLENVSGKALVISFVGYETQEILLKGKTSLNIILQEDTKSLEEVVVVGFGTQKKVNLSGSVSTVSGKDIARRPVANTAILLQGQIPGLRVNQSTGEPGAENVTFRVRGQGTFSSAGSDPLVLINGVAGNIANIDPSSIESVSVLKDASSAAIYGARAANGVILITTKSGKNNEKAHISYHGNVGFYSPTRLYDLVTNSVEYMELANIAWKNSGISKEYTQDMIDLYRKNGGSVEYPNFDWLDYMFRTATVQTHNITATGGSDKSTYNISLNYVNQPGTMRGFSYNKYNATIDLTAKINEHIRVGTYSSLMYSKSSGPVNGQMDALISTMSQAPTYMPWLPDDGTGEIKWTNKAYSSIEEGNKNMLVFLENDFLRETACYDVNSQLWLELNLFKGLTWYTKGAVRLESIRNEDWGGISTIVPVYDYHTGMQTGELGANLGLTAQDTRRFYTNLYSYLKYNTQIMNKHSLSVMLGYSQETEMYEYLNAYRKYYSFDLHTINAGASAEWTNGGGKQEWALQSLFGRLNYDYRGRYLFETNIRYDGTSRLASENRWGVFPSFSVGWRITEEPFIKKKNINWLDNLKIRGSWGQLGNQNVGLYPYQALISSVTDYPFTKTESGTITGYQQTAYANRDIKWETTTITDVGVDLSVFKGLNITFDWYNKVTDGILRASQVSALLGLSAPYINNGKVQNKGIELAVNYANMIKSGWVRGLQYNIGVYFDRSRNKLVDFGAEEIGDYFIRREGLPYEEYYMLECIGVFADQAEIDRSPKQFNDNILPGDLKFRDINEDGVVDNNDRRTFSGHFPGFEYGVNLSANWKNFDFSLIGQGVADKKYYTYNWGVQPFMQGSAPTRDYLEGMWTEEEPYGAVHPRLYWSDLGGGKNTRPSSYFLKDASFFRIKNITLGYTLPTRLTQKAGISRLRVYFSGDNLLTFTPYKGLDPERPGDGYDTQYPQNKICSFGINVEF